MTKCLIVATLSFALTAPAADAAIKRRQRRQTARISQGASSGALTGPEARRLNHARKDLNRTTRRDRISGGGLSGLGRVKSHTRQNHLSRRIYRQKHDAQER